MDILKRKLVRRCVITVVFEAMKPYQDWLKLLQDPTALESKVMQLCEGSFAMPSSLKALQNCPQAMQEFIMVKFQGHPEIMKEITLFMLIEGVDAMEMKNTHDVLKKVEKIAEQASSAASKLTNQANALKRNHDNLANKCKLLRMKK
jgi:hypothetical protein